MGTPSKTRVPSLERPRTQRLSQLLAANLCGNFKDACSWMFIKLSGCFRGRCVVLSVCTTAAELSEANLIPAPIVVFYPKDQSLCFVQGNINVFEAIINEEAHHFPAFLLHCGREVPLLKSSNKNHEFIVSQVRRYFCFFRSISAFDHS